jgi:ketosteroid isomerase-like protein
MKKHQLFFVPIIWASLFIGCQNTPDVATAEKLVREFNAKLQQQPYQTFEQNTSSDYVFISADGGFVSREDMVGMLKDAKFEKWDLQNLKVRALDNVFVATGINNHTIVGEDGKASTYNTAFTYVYQNKGGKLEQVAMQHTYVPNATKEE